MKKLITSMMVFSMLAFVVLPVVAANGGTVSATVTVENISVAVSDGDIAYGTLAIGDSEDTTSTGVNDTQTANNNGNVTVQMNIRGGADSTSWTLGSTAGDEQYVHGFCTTNCDTTPTWTPLTTSNQTLNASVTAGNSQDFDLEITTPSATTDFSEQTVTVIIQVSAS